MKFRVIAERASGIYGRDRDRPINPFQIRNIFDPNLISRTERRTWPEIEAPDESELRRLFSEYVNAVDDARGFRIVSIEHFAESSTVGRADSDAEPQDPQGAADPRGR